MILIYAHTQDGSQVLITRTDDDTFNVQVWAEKRKKTFRLLGITRISYEVIKIKESE